MRKLHLLERFKITAEEGSLHRAAKRLGITQPALTKSIRALEAEYDLPLFERHSKGVTLSRSGERLLAHVKVIDREIQMADADLLHLQTGQTGMLSIGGGAAWAAALLPSILARVQESYPELHINLITGSSRGLLQYLTDGDIDLMAGGLWEEADELPPYLTKKPLLTMDMKIIARPEHPLRKNGPATHRDLTQYPWVIYKGDLGSLEAGRERLRSLFGALPATLIYSESLMAMLSLVENGNYLAWFTPPFVDSIKGFSVEALPVAKKLPTFQSGLIYRTNLSTIAPFSFLLRAISQRTEESVFSEHTKAGR